MPSCHHHATFPCPWCFGQHYYWSGSQQPAAKIMTQVTIAGKGYIVQEGDANPKRDGLTLRPAAVLLAELLAAHDLAGLRVLELGAGLALPSIVAGAMGAHVTVSETDPVIAARVGDDLAARHALYKIYTGDWKDLAGPFDAIVGSEILFERPLILAALELVRRVWSGAGPVLFTDPDRRRAQIEAAAPVRGVALVRREMRGKMADGREFACDVWESPPTCPPARQREALQAIAEDIAARGEQLHVDFPPRTGPDPELMPSG